MENSRPSESRRVPGQKIYFIIVDGYIYLVPFVVGDEYLFLKTIIPSRKATREYQLESGD